MNPSTPPGAIREGLVNAFAHRDYSDFSGGIVVHIYPGRLEISNTGRFPEGVTPEKLKAGTLCLFCAIRISHTYCTCADIWKRLAGAAS